MSPIYQSLYTLNPIHSTDLNRTFTGVSDLEEAAQVVQGALWAQEAPRQDGAHLLTHGVEMGDEAVGHLRQTAESTEALRSSTCCPSDQVTQLNQPGSCSSLLLYSNTFGIDAFLSVLLLCIRKHFQPRTFMCCLFCFSTDQQLDATACETHIRSTENSLVLLMLYLSGVSMVRAHLWIIALYFHSPSP